MKSLLLLFLGWLFLSPALCLAGIFDQNLIGINYKGFPQSQDEINKDLAVLSKNFTYIKTYLDLFTPQQLVVPTVAANYPKMEVAIGLGLQKDNDSHSFPGSYYEIDTAIAQAKQYPNNVSAIVVGGENSLFYIGPDKLLEYVNYIKSSPDLPKTVKVTTQQKWGDLLNPVAAPVVNAVDYVLATIYPYFDGPGYSGGDPTKAGQDTLANWKTDFMTNYGKLAAAYGAGKIQIGETGWPTGGSQAQIDGVYTGVPSEDNQKSFLTQYNLFASTDPGAPSFTYIFEGIDEPDKSPEPGGVQAFWGLYDKDDNPKKIVRLVGSPGDGGGEEVPLPGTLLLSSSGLLGLMGWKRVRKA